MSSSQEMPKSLAFIFADLYIQCPRSGTVHMTSNCRSYGVEKGFQMISLDIQAGK